MAAEQHPPRVASGAGSTSPTAPLAGEPSPAPDPYRELFERSTDAILIIDGDRFVDCNQATVEMLRYGTREELLQTHPSELSPPHQPDGRPSYEKANEMIARAFAAGSHRFEWSHQRADGEIFPVEVLLTAVPREERQILHVVWRDISERKRLERELLQAQKMEAIGKLAGGIAHDFNNLLVAILGHADLLEAALPEESALRDHVREIVGASERAADLVRQLLAFSRKQVMKPRVIDLNATLQRLERLLERLLGEDVELRVRPTPSPLPIRADPGQLEQVVINLVTNARDAMPAGGLIVLETDAVTLDEQTIGAGALPAGRYALICVSDTGTGIDLAIQKRIFEPFFTTKPEGRGSGLGLSTVYGIVKQSHGEVTVNSAPGAGTVFRVYLPLCDDAPLDPPDEHAISRAAATPRAERLLLVEDEARVRSVMERVLRDAGYQVTSARNGLEALDLVESQGVEPDLLITDVIMPGLAGPRLVARLKERRPELKLLYASGYTDDALVHRGALEEGVDLLEKPFSPRTLLARVEEALRKE